MHHKRKRPRSARSGCKMCKPWKKNGAAKAKNRSWKERRDEAAARDQMNGG